MAGKLVAPTDKCTGLPLPVLPPPEIPSFDNKEFANWHHHYHPENSPLLKSPGGLAVRHVRLQLLPIKEYHDPYHGIFEGPVLPKTTQQRFSQIILSCAGYIPSKAIDIHSDNPAIPVALNEKLRTRLQTSGEIEVRGQSNICDFVKDYVVKQDLTGVKESLIEEFVFTTHHERKRFLGNWLLALASEIAVEPVKPLYRQAKKEGLIHPSNSRKLPNIVKSQINGRKTNQKAMKALHRQLKRQVLRVA